MSNDVFIGSPFYILLCREESSNFNITQKGFKSENDWDLELGFDYFVIEQWYDNESDDIVECLGKCGESIMRWSKHNCHKTRKEIENLCRKIEHIRLHVEEGNINYFTTLKTHEYSSD